MDGTSVEGPASGKGISRSQPQAELGLPHGTVPVILPTLVEDRAAVGLLRLTLMLAVVVWPKAMAAESRSGRSMGLK